VLSRRDQVEKLLVETKARHGGDTSSFTLDGWVLPRSSQSAFLSGSFQKVDLLIGLNGRELSAFRLAAAAASKTANRPAGPVGSGSLKQFTESARPCFGSWTRPAIALYIVNILVHRTEGVDAAANDIIGSCPIGAMASLTTAAAQHVFVYRFDRSVPGKGRAELGAFHSLEIPYVFGALHDPTWQWLPFTPDDAALSNLVQVYWANFVKTGNPNGQGLPTWPLWTEPKKNSSKSARTAQSQPSAIFLRYSQVYPPRTSGSASKATREVGLALRQRQVGCV